MEWIDLIKLRRRRSRRRLWIPRKRTTVNAEGRQRENEKNCIVVPNIVGSFPLALSESSRPFCAFPPSFFHSRSLTLSAISHGERLVILSLLHFYFRQKTGRLGGERDERREEVKTIRVRMSKIVRSDKPLPNNICSN